VVVLAAQTMSYLQAIVIGVLQGITELFPVSSLGHSVLVPELLGWDSLVHGQSAGESFYLAFLVGLHVATALALLVFFRRDWARVIAGFFTSIRKRRVDTPAERMAWLLIVGTIPVGVVGLVFEHSLRTVFAKPTAAAIFLTLNGCILLAGERLRRRAESRSLVEQNPHHTDPGNDVGRDLDTLHLREGVFVGSSQILALFAGISRSGVTMVAGLLRGLDHEDAARFSFMLATPVILAAGVYKLPDLLGHNGDHVRGQVLVGSIAAGISAYLAVRFLTRWFETRTLTPFAIYSLAFGITMILVTTL
jgi:undecaprenyl-diphosphatase